MPFKKLYIITPPYFNPRSPRGGATKMSQQQEQKLKHISIHAPHEGERQLYASTQTTINSISIHAPHEGERLGVVKSISWYSISIHAPHEGERPFVQVVLDMAVQSFQSTLPTRGSDLSCFSLNRLNLYFNPRSPRGGATAEKCICMQHFSEFAEYYPLRRGDARCIAPQDCIIQAFFGAKKRCFYVRLCFALKNKGVRG